MHSKSRFAVSLLALALAACSTAESPAPVNTLVVARAATAPTLDGNANDAVWAAAKPLTVKLSGGENFANGETTATLKSVVVGDTIFFLVQYADPTNSVRRGPLQKQADGTYKKLVAPTNKGGDETIYYEDKWAFIWNSNNSIAGFNQQGCGVTCHMGEGKPYGNKYTAKEGELGDMWHMKGSRTAPVGLVDDQYLDHTRYDKEKSPNAGRKSDPGGPEYTNLKIVNGKPEFMNPDGKPGNAGGKFYVIKGQEVPFDDSKFKAGDEVASYMILHAKGDRADIKVANSWSNGVLTSEVSRKLTTGSKTDVQFSNLNDTYYFGFAAFDNAQVRHAVHWDALKLVFAK